MNAQLSQFLEREMKKEQKHMFSYDVDDCVLGVETDKYTWCKNVVSGSASIESLIKYFKKYYDKDEVHFLNKIEELLGN